MSYTPQTSQNYRNMVATEYKEQFPKTFSAFTSMTGLAQAFAKS